MRQELRAIIAAQGKLARPTGAIDDETDLFEAGMDSLAVVNVMLAIEEHFEIEIPDRLLNRQTFSSIAALERALQSVPARTAMTS
jgi:acyl carrier protein